VKSVRPYITAIGLVITLLGSTSLSAFAAAAHPVCTVKDHDCGKQATIEPWCCGDASNTSDPAGPIVTKVTITATPASVATLFAAIVTPTLMHTAVVRAEASPPRAAPVDLPTLFASLLI
jgi:hypothetical protein